MHLKIIFTFVFSIYLNSLRACEPCKQPTVQVAYSQADIVLIGQRIGRIPGCGEKVPVKNATMVKKIQVVKGEITEEMLNVVACYGMCHYGLEMAEDSPHLIFLRRSKDKIETLPCAGPELPVTKSQVTIDGKEISVANLDQFFNSKGRLPEKKSAH